jgi:hypothetical protein
VARGEAQSEQGARWLERGAAAAILLVPLCLVTLRCTLSAELPWIVQREAAPWIMAPLPVTADLQQWNEVEVPVTRFSRRFRVEEPGRGLRLHVRALGDARVLVNGELAAELRRAGLRGRADREIEIGEMLRLGENELRVEVSNALGPGLLSVRSLTPSPPLVSDLSWSVRVGERVFAGAVRADDTRVNPRALTVETPWEAAIEKSDVLLGLFVLGAAVFWAGARVLGGRGEQIFAVSAPILASAAWLQLYVGKFARIPPVLGFDARHHLLYVERLLETGALPQAVEGWSTYHPPLFYGFAALVATLGGGDAVLKALPLLAGLGTVWMAWLLARGVFPHRPLVAGLAALFAATLPVNVYSAAYFSNEAFHGLFGSAGLLAAAHLLLAERVSLRATLLAGALFALAALSKFTVLVTVPVALCFLAWKLVLVERAAPARTAARLVAFAAVFLALAGWFYARSWLHYGVPVMGNWALPGEDQRWWQQPGFHTPAYYLRFGEALLHPYLAGFHSFWDSIYSTFWGDGFIAGRTDPYRRHDFWDYGFMSAGYWAALPATALLLAGLVLMVREALGAGASRRRLALAFLVTACWAVALAFVTLTFELPFFAQAKAAYFLMLTGPLALAFATAVAALDAALARRGWLAARIVLHGWLGLYAGTLFLAYAA